jgi:hypothetical protein
LSLGEDLLRQISPSGRAGAICHNKTQLPSPNKVPGEFKLLTDEECRSAAKQGFEHSVSLTTATLSLTPARAMWLLKIKYRTFSLDALTLMPCKW